MSRGATFYVANPLYHGASGAGLPQQQQNLVPSFQSQHYMPGVVPIGYIHAGQVPMQPPFVPAQPYVPPPIREPLPSSRFSFSFSSIWRRFRSLLNIGSGRNDLDVPNDDNQPLISEEREELTPVTLEHQPENERTSSQYRTDIDQPGESEEVESPTPAEQSSRFSFSFSALWISVQSIFKKTSHRSTLEFPADDKPILSQETVEDSSSSEHSSKDGIEYSQKDVHELQHSVQVASADPCVGQKLSSEGDELLGEPQMDKKLIKENIELPHEPQAKKISINDSDAQWKDQCYPMRKMLDKTHSSSALPLDERNDESLNEYTYIDDDDEPLIPEEESVVTVLSHLEAKIREPSVLHVDDQNPVQYHKVGISDKQSVAGINVKTPGEESIGMQVKWMASSSPDDMEPLKVPQTDTSPAKGEVLQKFHSNCYEEQTALHPISRENQSHVDNSANNYCAEEASQLYIVERETIAVAAMISTRVVQCHTVGTDVQPTEKTTESKRDQDQVLKRTVNTEESTEVWQPNHDRWTSFELTNDPTSEYDISSTKNSNTSGQRQSSKKSRWMTSTADDKIAVIDREACVPVRDSTSVISAVQPPSSMDATTTSEAQILQDELVADTTRVQNDTDSSSHNSHNARIITEMEQKFKDESALAIKHYSRKSSSFDKIEGQQQLVPRNGSQMLPPPNSSSVDQQQVGDSLKPMRDEWMKRNESTELLKGPKKRSMQLEDHDVKVEDITQGSSDKQCHDPMPHESAFSTTATSLHAQGDSVVVMNSDMESTMNATIVPDAPTKTAIEMYQGEEATIDGNGSEQKNAQNEEKLEKTLKEKIDEVIPEEDRKVYRDLVTAVDESFIDSERKCCTCTCGCCIQSCCFSLSCIDTQNCFKKGPENVKVDKIATEATQEGNRVGWKMFNKLVFPLINRRLFKFLITGFEIILGLIGFILSCISFSLGNNAVYNIIHFILAVLATAFGIIDFFTSLSTCMVEKCCNSKTEKLKSCAARTCCCCTIGDILKGWDVIRVLVNELLFYPLLICDLIEFIVDKGYRFQAENGEDALSIFLFFHSSISLIFYVYILRLILLVSMIYHLHKKRTLSPEQKKLITEVTTSRGQDTGIDPPVKQLESNDNGLDPKIANNAMKFQGYFVYHVAGQMAAQILMIAAISLKLHKDNEFKTLSDPVYISNELWFMLIAGGIMPLLGILTFLIPTFYWVYEYPCGICIDMLSILETPGFGHIICYGEETEDMKEKVMNIAKRLNKDQLKKDFLDLTNKAFSSKVGYAFKNPLLVVICLVYSIFQLVFVIVAIVGIQSGAPDTVFFYILSIVVGFAANLYVFLVAAFWMTIIIGILILIAVIVALIVLVILLLSCGGSNSNNKRSYI